MQDKVVLITGATNGIGKVAAFQIAQMGAHVVLVGRNAEKTQAVVTELKAEIPHAKADFLLADLSCMNDVRKLSQEFQQQHKRLDVLLNNAGAMFEKRTETPEGFEQTLALNHLNYFLLTHELLGLIKETAKQHGEARIVNVASDAHQWGTSSALLKDPHAKNKYKSFNRYGESKLANIMFTYELARRLEGTNVTVNVLHPGFVATGFAHNNGGFVKWVTKIGQSLFAMSEERGAETLVYLSTSPEVKGVTGTYFYKCKPTKSNKDSHDTEAQKQLWTLTEELLGISTSA